MSTAAGGRYTYGDLASFPDDGNRYELIDGELFVTPAPGTRHQAVVQALAVLLGTYVAAHGGRVYPAPVDVRFDDDTVLEPDLVVVTAEHVGRVRDAWIEAPPDLVVEVSSPSTASHDLIRKRRIYDRAGVAEYWYVDLDGGQVFVHRLEAAGYRDPDASGPGEVALSQVLEGLEIPVDTLLAAR